MGNRREMYGAAARLACVISALATLLAVVLDAVGELSTVRFVSFVFVVGLVASWTVTGRVARLAEVRAP
jgi:hypothetical protein